MEGHVPKAAARFAPRVRGRHAESHEIILALGEMEAHLAVDVARQLVGARLIPEA
jgi:hypothetical protein